MKNILATGVLRIAPNVTVYSGPEADSIAHRSGLLEPLRAWVRGRVNSTGTSHRAIATAIQGEELIGAIYWDGFEDPEENGVVCCVGRCTKPEDMPIALMGLAQFFSCTIEQDQTPWAGN